MELQYPRKADGLYILKKMDMEHIADMILREHMPMALLDSNVVDIDALAEDALYLTIREMHLESSKKILGLLAFEDVEDVPCLDESGDSITIDIPAGTVLLDSSLSEASNKARRRFTLAHECAHWILHRSYHSLTNQQFRFRVEHPGYIACRSSEIESYQNEDKAKTEKDWEEWQANALASALLMPYHSFRMFVRWLLYINEVKRKEYVDYWMHRELVGAVSDRFEVSEQAATIRLRQFGIVDRALHQDTSYAFSLKS